MNASAANPEKRGLFLKHLLLTMLFVGIALLVWRTLQILMLIFAGVIFAVFLNRTGRWIYNHTRLPFPVSVSVVVFFLLALSVLLTSLMAPRITSQIDRFSNQFPEALEHAKEKISDYYLGEWFVNRLTNENNKSGRGGIPFDQATGWMFSFVGGLTGILIIMVLGIYLSYGADLYIVGTLKLMPKDKRDRGRRVLHGMGATLYWWLIGRLVSMVIIAVLTYGGLTLMNVPLALTLAVFAGIMTFIPNIGPLLSVIPAIVFALPQGWDQAGYVSLLYLGIQTIESYFITPMVQRQIIAMPPALILSAQLIMGVIQGVFGILLATPLVAVIMVVVKLVYIEGKLEDADVAIHAEELENNHRTFTTDSSNS
jgi:predicted PurR-regulated permease PerM